MVNSSAASERMPAARDGVVFSVRDPLYRVLAIGLAGHIIGANSLNNLLPRVVQCVAEWGTSRVGYRHARRVQFIFFVSLRRHARGECFLIVAAVPVCALKANGTVLFFLRSRSARGLLICSTTAKHNRTCRYHKE